MKKLFIAAALISVFIGSSLANAINLPIYMEFDLDNWTRLYSEPDVPIAEGDPVVAGDMSRAFISFSDIAPTSGADGSDCGDCGPRWVTGLTDGTYLHGWFDNIIIQPGGVIDQGDGSVNLYFTHADATSWEFEVYNNTITTLDFITDSNYLQAGPTMFDTIKSNVENHASSVPFVRGRFSESLYFDQALDDFVLAVAAIKVPGGTPGGVWTNQINLPYGLGVNAFIDVDPTWGIGEQFRQNFYGWPVPFSIFNNQDPYDLAIQNVRLNSEIGPITDDDEFWIISDDGIRGAAIPEPATMLLLGTGLIGLGGAVRRKNKKQA